MKVDTPRPTPSLAGLVIRYRPTARKGAKLSTSMGKPSPCTSTKYTHTSDSGMATRKPVSTCRIIMMGRGEDEASAQNTAAISIAVLA